MPTPASQRPAAPPESPKIYAISRVLDFIRAMRTATSIRPSEAKEFAELEEEFETRHRDAVNSDGT